MCPAYGGTGAEPEITATQAEQARANAAYDQIRTNDDVAQVAQNTGHSPEQIQAVKDHLFNSQHDIFNPETGTSAPGNFTPDEGIANLWNKAADGSLGQPRLNKWGDPIPGTESPGEVTDFNRLIAYKYVEQGLVSDGLPYQHPDSWVQDASGEWQYQPGPDNIGAHDLSPNFRDDPFSHYESLLERSSEGIPRPNADNSNLDDVLAGVRRSLGGEGGLEGSPPGGGGPGGPEGGPRVRPPWRRPARGAVHASSPAASQPARGPPRHPRTQGPACHRAPAEGATIPDLPHAVFLAPQRQPMKTYYTNEVRFVIPARTVDRTVNAFIVPAGGPLDPVDPDEKGEFSLVITRAPMTAGDTLPAYVARQVAAVREMLPEFRLLSRHPATIDNLPAEQVDFTWRSEDALMRQQQTHFRHGDLVVSVTGTALDALYAKHRPVLEQALLTMKLNT